MRTHKSPAAAHRRADILFAVVASAGLVVLAWVVITIQELGHDLHTANDARDALARQVQTLGHKPVAGPPGSRGEPGKTVVGPRGPKGDTGASGKPAPTITPSPGPTGPAGKDGANSTVPGPSGAPGADSTVAGPSGPPGAAGRDGTDGRDGSDGKPPAGWSYTWTDGTGVTHHVTCTRKADSPDDAPDYDCEDTSTEAPAPSDGPGRGLLGAVALASASSYRKLGGGPHA